MRYQYKQGSAAVLGLVVTLLAAVPAVAEKEGWYITGSGYHTQLQESENDDFQAQTTCVPLVGCTTSVQEFNYDAGFESDRNFGLQIGFDRRGPFRFDVELRSFKNNIDRRQFTDGSVDRGGETVDTRSLAFNFWHDFNHLGAFRPYLGLGMGYADVELNDADDEIPFVQAGVGVNWFFTDRLALDVGYRYFLGDDPEFERSSRQVESEYEGQSYTVGLRFNFFSSASDIGDSDGDGVNDRADRCPGTPRNATVDRYGCAVDSDNDGVSDYLDQCPGTPVGTEVDAHGCKVHNDHDNDGVVNAKDQCPGTPSGEPVLSTGCSANQSQVLEGVTFELDSSTLTREAREQCREVAGLMAAGSKGFDVEVQGHTDNQGDKAYNQRLSQERAESFKQCLVTEGVDEARLTAAGYGEAQSIADNGTASGRARNRRVELEVIE